MSVDKGIQYPSVGILNIWKGTDGSKLQEISSHFGKVKETEFDLFGITIASQLNNVPLNEVLQLQLKIQQLEMYD
jgi:hypothetical protein